MWTMNKVSDNQRSAAKAINFGLMYGMSAFGLGRQLDISRPEAQEYMDTYFSRYPGVQVFMEKTREQAREQGLCRNPVWAQVISTGNQREQYDATPGR